MRPQIWALPTTDCHSCGSLRWLGKQEADTVLQNSTVYNGAVTKVCCSGSTIHALELLASVNHFYADPVQHGKGFGANGPGKRKAGSARRGADLKRAYEPDNGKPLSAIYAMSPECTVGELARPLNLLRCPIEEPCSRGAGL